VQEIFGVTDHIRALCDEYAADGYEVLSPAIFDREHPGFEADYTGPDYNRAVELARDLHPFAQSLDDAQVCIDALKAFDTIYVITQGGPGSASETINIFLYLQAFAFYNVGYASAVVVVFFIIILALAALLLWTRQRVKMT
jgi:hypothetical protein